MRVRMSLRSFRSAGVIVVAIVSLLLSACTTGTGSSETSSEGEGQGGGSLTIATISDVQNLDPANYVLIRDLLSDDFLFDGLVTFDAELQPRPALATEWEQLDERTWEFKLRSDVKFHDGTDFDAEAVKFSLERAGKAPQGAAILGQIDSVEVVDPLTVRIHLLRPYSALLGALASGIGDIVSPTAVEEHGEDFAQNPVGTGPYVLAEWTPNTQMRLTKFEDYWNTDYPLDEIIFRTIPEDSTRYNALQNGEVDVVENPPPDQREAIESNPDLELVVEPRARVVGLWFNLKNPKLEDKRVREAIAHAIDKDAIVSGVLEGLGTPVENGMFEPDFFPQPNPPITLEFDPELSKQLLQEAGVTDLKLSFTVPQARYFKDVEAATVIQDQLADIGIEVELDVHETGAWFDKLLSHKTDIFWLGWGVNNGDVSERLGGTFPSDSQVNTAQYNNPQYDAWLEDIERLPVGSPEREEILFRMQEAVLIEDVVWQPIYFMVNFWATRSNVSEFHTTPLELLNLSETTVSS